MCGTSGWRRIVPVALHGASSSTASNGSAGVHAAASACTTFGLQSPVPQVLPQSRQPRRVTLHRERPTAPAAASCAVLPPGAAQRSATRSPGRAASSLAGSAAAASCTQNSPRSNPGISATRVPAGNRTEPVGRIVATRRQPSRPVAASGRAAPHVDARWRSPAPCRPTTPRARPACPAAVRPVRPAQRAPASATRRSTALTMPANGASPRARASATAVATAAWLGVSSSSSPAAPSRSTWRTGSGGALRRIRLQHRVQRAHAGAAPRRPADAPPHDRAAPVAAARPAPPRAAGGGPAPRSADRRQPRASGRPSPRHGVTARQVTARPCSRQRAST